MESILPRFVVSIGISWTIDYGIIGNDINGYNMFSNVLSSIIGEGLSYVWVEYLYSFLPRNYSQFKHDISQFFPDITRQETYTAMKIFSQVIDTTCSVIDFFIDLFGNVEVTE